MQRKRLEDMNLLDDFLFNAVMTFPGIGERFCRLLLQVVLGREIGRLRVVAQRAFGGRDEGFRGARLDVLAEEELMDVLADPSVFDIEPDNNDDVVSLKDLPKRVRFYHAIIDSRCLKKGEGFGKLKRVFVIFVCSYDPFDRGRMVYTIRNMCEEVPEMEYDDGLRTVFLNTKGDGAGVPEELAAHRGLPNAKLFTDLDQMEKGDIFILHILGKHLAYKVDQIKTVLPDETSDLDIIEGEDHVTLITCTPYGVNTHRLLVRGVRTKYVVEDTKNDETIPQKLAVVDPKRVLAGGAAVLVVLILLIYLIVRHRDKKRKKKQLSERKEEAESDEK